RRSPARPLRRVPPSSCLPALALRRAPPPASPHSPSCALLSPQDQIQQFVRHVNLLHDALSVHMLRDSRKRQRQANHVRLGGPNRNFDPSAHASIDLDWNFDFLFAREFLVERGPAYFPEPFSVSQHFPKF